MIKFTAALLFSLSLFSYAAHAEQQQDIRNYSYAVYAGGFYVLDADMTLTHTDDTYDIHLDTKTHGLLDRVVSWAGIFETTGEIKGDERQVLEHKSTATFRGDTNIKSYAYNPDGQFKSLTLTDHEKNKEPVTTVSDIKPELADGSTDILTAMLSMMSDDAPCNDRADVFDGKRRFEIVFRKLDDTVLSTSRYNSYGGPASVCEIEIFPKGGKWHEKPRGWLSIQEQGREKGQLPRLWVAEIDGLYVPVKILVKTNYGTFLMHKSDQVVH